ncbi:MAG: hypothetical protein AAGA66_20055, partial [Bacteroidota bacterium]
LVVNNLDGQLPETFFDLINLQTLWLGGNSFSGELSPKIGNLLNLKTMSIIDNLFEGQLPASFGNLTALDRFSIDFNGFEGEIPDTFRNLKVLRYFSVRKNQLSGKIPQFFADFPLEYFWIRDNDFQVIPDFSNHPSPGSIRFNVEGNQLDFGDLEPNWTEEGGIFSRPRYDNQDSVTTFYASETRTYSVEVGGQFNQYQWHRNGTAIPGAVGPSYTVPLNGDLATYQCRITNTLIDDLTLWSESMATRAGQYYAVADGDWNELIWSREKDGPVTDTTPGIGSEVFIIGKHVTLRNDLSTGPIHVIVENEGASLTVDRAELTVAGTLDLTKETDGYPGDVFVINGGRIKPVNP